MKISLLFSLSFLTIQLSAQENLPADIPVEKREALLDGEVIVELVDLQDDVMGMSGDIFIECPPQDVWRVLVDFDNLARFLPTMLYSKLIEEESGKKIVDQILRVKVLFFERKLRTKLEITEDYLKRVHWEMLDGDFYVYRGSWMLTYDDKAEGTFLAYSAEIKPRFTAPKSLSRQIQKKDIPKTLRAIQKWAGQLKASTESRD